MKLPKNPTEAQILAVTGLVIKSIYTRGTVAVQTLDLDSQGRLTGIFLGDGVRFRYTIDNGILSYAPVNPKDLPSEEGISLSEDALDFARLKIAGNTKQEKKCKVGYACGYSCISQGKVCNKALPGQAKNGAEWVKMQKEKESQQQGQQQAEDSLDKWIDAELKKLGLKKKGVGQLKPVRGIEADQNVMQDVNRIRQFKKVGEGVQGEVFIDEVNNIVYKVPKAGFGTAPDGAEVKLLVDANKVGVGPKILGFDPNTGIIAMQRIDGVPVESRKRIGKAQAKSAMRDLVQQVQALHNANIAHTDLHGGNILIGKDGARIIDFGFAKRRPSQRDRSTDILQMMYVFQQQGWMSSSNPRATQKTAADDLIWELLREQKKGKLPPDIYDRILNLIG